MVANNYEPSLKRTLVYEGGNVDHPDDPGGATRQGVTQAVYDGYRDNLKLPRRHVFQMTDQERNAIYRNQYWNAIKGDRLPLGVDFVVFDGAVNSGPKQSVLWLQRALGTVKVDGLLGEATIAATCAYPNHDELVARICDQRLRFLQALRTWKTFGKGWRRRVMDVCRAGQEWATGFDPVPAQGAVGLLGVAMAAKAPETDVKKAPSQLVGASILAIGSGLPALKDSLLSLRDELYSYVDTAPFVQPIIDHLSLAGSALAVVGMIYAGYGWLKSQHLNAAIGTTTADT